MKVLTLLFLWIFLSACADTTSLAPVVDIEDRPQIMAHGSHFIWPVKGRIVKFFSENNRGLDIQSSSRMDVRACETGQVVYAGNGLHGYGNLMIIKHKNNYLSAYAYNRILLFKEGDFVHRGQKIAEIGKSGSSKGILHFEIRKWGRPINPLSVLSLEH